MPDPHARPERHDETVRHLVVLSGPIGAGKSTVAVQLCARLAGTGMTVARADLDDLAFAQHGVDDVAGLWHRAGIAHVALVRGWFEAGTDAVVVDGPFFESRSYERLFAARPDGASTHHAVLDVAFDVALRRVLADPHRSPGSRSTDPDFLRATHEALGDLLPTLPDVDLVVDTSGAAVTDIVDRLAALVEGPAPPRR